MSAPKTSWGWIRRPLLAALIVGLTIAGYHVLRIMIFAYAISRVDHEPTLIRHTATSSRGDEITAVTDTGASPEHTVVRLRPAGAWFSTLLLDVDDERGVGVSWAGEDSVDIDLKLGPEAHIATLIERVGSIHIRYVIEGNNFLPKRSAASISVFSSRRI